MNEEEKKAIETLKSWKDYNIRNKNKLLQADEIINVQEIILNLIEKLQKENEILKEEKAEAWEEWNILEQGSYETEQRLKSENEKLKALDLRNSKMIANMSTRHFQDREKIRNSIPIQKVKDKIKELEQQDREWTEELSEPDSNFKNIDRNLKRIKNQVAVLQELLEGEQS